MIERYIVRDVKVWDNDAKQTVVIDLDVVIDPAWIAHNLAAKAYNNRSRKSRALHGLVEVSMRGTKVTPLAAIKVPA